jgi:hypothetical protein
MSPDLCEWQLSCNGTPSQAAPDVLHHRHAERGSGTSAIKDSESCRDQSERSAVKSSFVMVRVVKNNVSAKIKCQCTGL